MPSFAVSSVNINPATNSKVPQDEDFEASDPSDYEEEGVQEESDAEDDEDEAEGQSEESSGVGEDSSDEVEWLGFGDEVEKSDEDDGDVHNEAGRGQVVIDSLNTENKPQGSGRYYLVFPAMISNDKQSLEPNMFRRT